MRLMLALLASALPIHASDSRLFEAVEPHMGTLFRIKLYAAGERQAEQVFRVAFDRIGALDAILSDYKPDSELNRISRMAVGHPVKISDDLAHVLLESQKLAAETSGAFDVTLGPVIRLWREARKSGRPPDAAALREAGARCGYRKLHLDTPKGEVELDEPGMQLDLGGIAKGYAADAALSVLNRLGIHSALVAASGDLAFSNPPPGERGWKIGIDGRVVELANAAVSTSGDVEQHLVAGGQRYSHVIDPITFLGLTRRIAVTVIAPRGIVADGASTAIGVLGPERGIEFVERHPDLAVVIVTGEDRRIGSSKSQLYGNLQ